MNHSTSRPPASRPFDPSNYLHSPEDMAAYLDATFLENDGDPAAVARALGDIARAKGMSQIALDAGLSRESLYKGLSGRRIPSLSTLVRVLNSLGLRLTVIPRAPGSSRSGPIHRVAEPRP